MTLNPVVDTASSLVVVSPPSYSNYVIYFTFARFCLLLIMVARC